MRIANSKWVSLLAVMITIAGCKEEETATVADSDSVTPAAVVTQPISYSIVAEYPHDITAYTEGLQYVDGNLYEGTGQYGKSDLRKLDLKTGKVLQQVKLDARYFGEGITVLNGKIYQLTYKEKTGFVYDQKSMKQLQTFSFDNNEGWGMTTDGTNLIYSDGTDKLYFMDPINLKVVKTLAVKDQYGPVLNINELEYIKGFVYANQWQEDVIMKIDIKTGQVVAAADMRNLRGQTNIPAPTGNDLEPEVMNGIAYDSINNRIFITGKNWPKLFEVKLDN